MRSLTPFLFAVALPFTTALPFSFSSLASRFHSLARRDFSSTTQNDLTNGTPCRAITVIFARGTVSPGNMGENVGPPFVEAIAALVGNDSLAVQGVDYPASILGFLEGGDAAGSILMANLTTQAMARCPNSKIVLSGYR
jgi:cutinase